MERSTRTITLRLKKDMWPELEKRATDRGQTIGQYLQECIKKSLKSGVPEKVEASDSGVPLVYHSKPTKQELQDMIHKIENKVPEPSIIVPWYDPEKHTMGDTVRMRDPNNSVKVVTL